MATNPKTVMTRRKKEITSQIKRLQKELQQIDKDLQTYEKLAHSYSDRDTENNSSYGGSGSGGEPNSGVKPGLVLAEVEKILVEAEAPMTRKELLEILEARGMRFKSTNPANAIGTAVARSTKMFIHLKGFGYWLRSRDFPPAHYFANSTLPNDSVVIDEASAETKLN